MKYYIMVKRKGAKKWFGAIPVKKSTSKDKLNKILKKQLKAGFTYKIVSGTALKRYLNTIYKKRRKSMVGKKRKKKGKKRR